VGGNPSFFLMKKIWAIRRIAAELFPYPVPSRPLRPTGHFSVQRKRLYDALPLLPPSLGPMSRPLFSGKISAAFLDYIFPYFSLALFRRGFSILSPRGTAPRSTKGLLVRLPFFFPKAPFLRRDRPFGRAPLFLTGSFPPLSKSPAPFPMKKSSGGQTGILHWGCAS